MFVWVTGTALVASLTAISLPKHWTLMNLAQFGGTQWLQLNNPKDFNAGEERSAYETYKQRYFHDPSPLRLFLFAGEAFVVTARSDKAGRASGVVAYTLKLEEVSA
jgi:hypothetical protein